MSVEQLNEIMPNLSISQIRSLTMAQIQGLPNTTLIAQLANITKEQIQCITVSQLASIGTAIAPQISNLSAAQFLSLSAAQIQLMTTDNINDQLANLSTIQIGYLLPEEVATITIDQINKMTKDQLTALQTLLQNPAIITTTNDPALASQIAAIAVAPGNQAPVAAPTKAKVSAKKASVHAGGAARDIQQQNNDAKKKITQAGKSIKKAFHI
jgi:hypothetical protein